MDLSGVTGNISYVYDNSVQYIPQILIAAGSFIVLVIVACMMFDIYHKITSKRRSKEYRELIADMYVVGKIKRLAEEDKVNIFEELKEYSLVCKKAKLNNIKELDKAVEYYLQTKLDESKAEKIAGEKSKKE